MRPDLSRVGTFYHNYINQVPENDINKAFETQSASLFRFLETIPLKNMITAMQRENGP